MLRECRPSLKSSLFAQLRFDSRDNPVVPTRGLFARCRLVRPFPAFFRRVSAASSAMSETAASTPRSPPRSRSPRPSAKRPVWRSISLPTGVSSATSADAPHATLTVSSSVTLSEEFHVAGEHIRGFETAEIGPRSRPEGGGDGGLACRWRETRGRRAGWRPLSGGGRCGELSRGSKHLGNSRTGVLEHGLDLESQ